MHEYREKTEPLIAYYRRRGVLREVDGLGTVEAVAQRIAQALDGSEGR
jgi:adenylate kinase